MSLNEKLKDLVDSVDGALGAAVVEVDTGLIIGVHHMIPYFTQSYIDAVAAAAAEMFRGRTVNTIERLLGAQRGEDKFGLIKEVQMTSDNTLHFISIVPGKEGSIAILTTSRKSNLGMGWSSLRLSLDGLAPYCV